MPHPSQLSNPAAEEFLTVAQKFIPEINIHTYSIKHSYDNHVLEINEELIFRFPRSKALRAAKSEAAVLANIFGKTSITTPHILLNALEEPVPFILYKKLQGDELPPHLTNSASQQLVSDLANFFAQLHEAISVEQAKSFGVRTASFYAEDFVMNSIHLIPNQHKELINNACAITNAILKNPGDIVFLHNDLHPYNLAWNKSTNQVDGIFDFGDGCIGDCNMEFVPLFCSRPTLAWQIALKYQALTGRQLIREKILALAIERLAYDLVDTYTSPATDIYLECLENLDNIANLCPDSLASYHKLLI